MKGLGPVVFILGVLALVTVLLSAQIQREANQHERQCAARSSIAVMTVGGERACVPGVYAYEGE